MFKLLKTNDLEYNIMYKTTLIPSRKKNIIYTFSPWNSFFWITFDSSRKQCFIRWLSLTIWSALQLYIWTKPSFSASLVLLERDCGMVRRKPTLRPILKIWEFMVWTSYLYCVLFMLKHSNTIYNLTYISEFDDKIYHICGRQWDESSYTQCFFCTEGFKFLIWSTIPPIFEK